MADIKKIIDENNVADLNTVSNQQLLSWEYEANGKKYNVFQYAVLQNKPDILRALFYPHEDAAPRFSMAYWQEVVTDDLNPQRMSAIELAVHDLKGDILGLFVAPLDNPAAPPSDEIFENLAKLVAFADYMQVCETNGQTEQRKAYFEQLKNLKAQLLKQYPENYISTLVRLGDWPALQSLQLDNSQLVEARIGAGNSYLHMAAAQKDINAIQMVEYLVSQNLEANLQNDYGDTPLHAAILEENILVTSYLSQRTRLNCPNNNGFYPIHLAAQQGFAQGAEAILMNGGDINALTNDGGTALHLLANQIKPPIGDESYKKYYNLIALLLTRGARSEIKNAEGKTCFEILDDKLGVPGAGEIGRLKEIIKNLNHSAGQSEIENLVFKGGSIKGYAYLGSLKQAEEKGLLTLPDIKKVGGTSAGAITALFLGLGYSLGETQEKIGAMNMISFLDYQHRETLYQWYRNGAGKFELMYNRAIIYDVWEKIKTGYGVCDGTVFLNWINEVINERLKGTTLEGKENITFAELHEAKGGAFKDMAFVGVNVSKGGVPEVFSYQTTPNMCVADAVRISMSLPLVFRPWQKYIKNEKGERVLESGDLYVDGGIGWNFPLGIFDEDKFHVNSKTLGFCLVDPTEYLELAGGRIPESLNIQDILTFLGTVVGALFRGQDYHQTREGDRERTVYINTGKYGMLDFDLTQEDKDNLFQYGVQGVNHFIERKKNFSKVKLSAKLCQMLIKRAVIEQHNHKDAIRFTLRRERLSAFVLYEIYSVATPKEIPYLRGFFNPNGMDEHGNSPLHIAFAYDDQQAIDNLLNANANPHKLNNVELTYQKLNIEQVGLIKEKYPKSKLKRKDLEILVEAQNSEIEGLKKKCTEQEELAGNEREEHFRSIQELQQRELVANQTRLQLQTQLNSLIVEAEKMKHEQAQTQNRLQELEGQLMAVKQREEALTQEKQKLQAQLGELTRLHQQQLVNYQSLEKDIDGLNTQIAVLKQQVAQLNQSYDASQRAVEELESKARESSAQYKQEIAKRQGEIDALNRRHEMDKKSIQVSRCQAAQSQQQYDQLRAALSKAWGSAENPEILRALKQVLLDGGIVTPAQAERLLQEPVLTVSASASVSATPGHGK